MNHPTSTVGRVCLCEWAGPVSVAMIVGLLSHLKRTRDAEGASLLLIIHASAASLRCMARPSSPFLSGLPALMGSCHELMVVSSDNALPDLAREQHVVMPPHYQSSKRVLFYALLDDAFKEAQESFPHEVLELRRQRIRSGAWLPAATNLLATTDECDKNAS